jgi:hypothetical protein
MKKYIEQLEACRHRREVYPLTHQFLSTLTGKSQAIHQALVQLKRGLHDTGEPGSYWHNKGKQEITEHFEYVMWEYY